MSEQQNYIVGQLDNQQSDDKIFDDYGDAIQAAKSGSWNDSVWAVWLHPEGGIEALIYQQTEYTP